MSIAAMERPAPLAWWKMGDRIAYQTSQFVIELDQGTDERMYSEYAEWQALRVVWDLLEQRSGRKFSPYARPDSSLVELSRERLRRYFVGFQAHYHLMRTTAYRIPYCEDPQGTLELVAQILEH